MLRFLVWERQNKETVDGVACCIFKRGINGEIIFKISAIGFKLGHDVLTVLGVLLVVSHM